MKKLNKSVYQRLLLQAEEAKYQKMDKLAAGIVNSLTPYPEDENVTYASNELDDDVYQGLWKLATCVLKYHDVSSASAEKLDQVIEAFASNFIQELENSLEIKGSKIGPLEPILPGESK